MDLAQEVISKLIRSDKELTAAIKTTAKKFMESKKFDDKVAQAICGEIETNLENYLDDGALSDAIEKIVKTRLSEVLALPSVQKKLDAAFEKEISSNLLVILKNLLDSGTDFSNDVDEAVEEAARKRFNIPKPEPKKKKK